MWFVQFKAHTQRHTFPTVKKRIDPDHRFFLNEFLIFDTKSFRCSLMSRNLIISYQSSMDSQFVKDDDAIQKLGTSWEPLFGMLRIPVGTSFPIRRRHARFSTACVIPSSGYDWAKICKDVWSKKSFESFEYHSSPTHLYIWFHLVIVCHSHCSQVSCWELEPFGMWRLGREPGLKRYPWYPQESQRWVFESDSFAQV